MQAAPRKFAEGDAKLLKKAAYYGAYETKLYSVLSAVNAEAKEFDLSKYDAELADITQIRQLMFLVRVNEQQIPDSIKSEVFEESRRGEMQAIIDVELKKQELKQEESEE